jgi:ArsR family transcriptional regulator
MKQVLKIFGALSDPTRLRVVLLLLEGDLCVCELEFVLKMSQSRISHQLRILRDAGLVVDRREGQWMVYSIPAPMKARLRRALDALGLPELTEAAEIASDRVNLGACLRRGMRPRSKTGGSPGAKGVSA